MNIFPLMILSFVFVAGVFFCDMDDNKKARNVWLTALIGLLILLAFI